MPKGFFAKSELLSKAPPMILPQCGACGLYKGCNSPKMPYSGSGEKKILIVGEAPGAEEDARGKQFIGKAGQFLQESLEEVGIKMRRDCWITNALICRPPNNKIMDKRMIDWCRPNLMRTVRELQPNVILLFGGSAVRSLIGEIWRDNPGDVSRWVGWNIPEQKLNTWICPTYHPSYLLREHNSTLDKIFIEHLRKAVSHEKRPWDEIPQWDKEVEVILDTDEAARIVDEMEQAGGLFVIDYENNCLKPEYDGGEIICCGVCHEGKRTIAFPWHGKAIEAVGRLVHSKRCRFIAANLKHEDRWTRKYFGRGVRRWAWDTMIAAHTLDNRENICALKFQSFVCLGAPTWDDHIKKLLQPVKGKKLNQAKSEINLFQLLKYCAIDNLHEFKLAEHQVNQFELRGHDN
jgi:uracil-DNA glycosylase family 4